MLDLAVLPATPGAGPTRDSALHLAKHRIREGVTEIVIDVAGEPGAVVIDPFVLRVDRDPTDNRREVTGMD
jgi:hypothetical protein